MVDRRNLASLLKLFVIALLAVSGILFFGPEKEIPAQQSCTIVWGHPEVMCPDDPQSSQPPGGGGGGGDPGDPIIVCTTCLNGGSGGGGGTPADLAPDDDGSVAYTGRVDPADDPTRDSTVVDPSSGSMTFTLPLIHSIKGRAKDVNLSMTFRSNLNWPQGKFGNFWQGSWQKLLVVEYSDRILESECADLPKEADARDWINSIPRITEHNGESGTQIWTNRDAMDGSWAFTGGAVVAVPSGNLSGKAEIIPPHDPNDTYQIFEQDCLTPEGAPKSSVQPLTPLPIGDLDQGGARLGYSEFVPTLGVFDRMDFNCDEIRIRRPNGTIDVFSQFRPRQEHVFPSTTGEGPSTPPGSPPPDPYIDLRVQAVAVPLRTEFPNGDVITFEYDPATGRLDKIRDTYNRAVIKFHYECTDSNKLSRIETINNNEQLILQETQFFYDEEGLLKEIITPSHLDRTWKFAYDTVALGRPSIDPRIDLPYFYFLTKVRIFSPKSSPPSTPWPPTSGPGALPLVEADLTIFNQTDPVSHDTTAKVTTLWLGNKHQSYGNFVETVGGTNFTFNTGKEVNYSYPDPDPSCVDDEFAVVVSDQQGLTTTHRFDWMSRELERKHEFTYDGQSYDLKTEFHYRLKNETENDYYPQIRTTVHPNGNWTEELYQFEVDDDAGLSYFTRDRFQGGNLLRKTQGHEDPSGPAFIVEHWTYEPFLNQIHTHLDPLGRETKHFYDYQEGGWSTAFQQEWTFWGIDPSYSGILLNQGNLNDDDNSIRQWMGNRIKTEYETVLHAINSLAEELIGSSQSIIGTCGYNDKGQKIWERDSEGYFTRYDYYPENDPDGDLEDLIAGNSSDPHGYLKESTGDAVPVGPPAGPTGHTPLQLTTLHGYDKLGRSTWTVDPRGVTSNKAYDEANRVAWEARGEVNDDGEPTDLNADNEIVFQRTEFFYDGADNLIEVREENDDPFTGTEGINSGHVTERYGYDLLDQVRLVERELIDPTNAPNPPSRFLQTFYHYDDNGKVFKEVSAEGRATTYRYDSLARVRAKRKHLTLDSNPSLEDLPGDLPTDPLIEFDYDGNNNLRYVDRAQEDANDPTIFHTTEFFYDHFDRRTAMKQPEGIKIAHELDHAGNITNVTRSGPRDSYALDSDGDTLAEATYVYDELNRLTEIQTEYFRWEKDEQDQWQNIQIEGGTIRKEFAYDQRSLKIAERNHRSNGGMVEPLTTTFEYDGLGRETKRILPALPDPDAPGSFLPANWAAQEYDNNGNVTAEVTHEVGRDDLGNTVQKDYRTEKTHDELDRVILEKVLPETAGPAPLETEMFYTSRGDLLKTINPNNVGTLLYTDSLHREVAKEFGYDAAFTSGTIQDPAGVNPDGLIRTETDYDDDDNIRLQRDDNQISAPIPTATETRYDNAGRMTGLIYADQTKEEIVYNRDGTLREERNYGDLAGADLLFWVEYGYDDALRKEIATFHLDSQALPLEGVTEEKFIYDGLSRVTTATAKSFVTNGGDQTDFTSTLTKLYDSLGNVVSDDQALTIEYPDGFGGTISDPYDDTTVCEFDTSGNRTRVTCGSGAYDVYYDFDKLNRIESIDRGGPALHQFEYLGASTRLRNLTNANSTSTKVGINGYDGFRRLNRITHEKSSVEFSDLGYAYDAVGNQLHEARFLDTARSQSYEYDKANRLLRYFEGPNLNSSDPMKQEFGMDGVGNWREHQIDNGSGLVTHQHTVDDIHAYQGTFDGNTILDDKRGNLTQYNTTSPSVNSTYTYDARGRIVKAVVNGTARFYAFDAEGRRVFANGWMITHEQEREIRQKKLSVNPKIREFVYGTGIDEICSYRKDGVEYTIHKNRIGSTVAITDSSGNVTTEYAYTPYGVKTVISGSTVGFPYLFAGRRLDTETGLYFMRARSYHPEMGRFTARDQVGLWGDANNWGNPYAYGFNNPFAGLDPTGNGFWSNLRDFGSGVVGGAVESLTFGAVSSESVGNALGANTEGGVFRAGSLTGAVGMGIAANLATGGAHGAIDAGLSITTGAVRVVVGLANGSTESVVGGLTQIGLELLPGSLPGSGRAAREGADSAAGSASRNATPSGNRSAGGNLSASCFPAGTLVATPIGLRKIEELRTGDLVYGYDRAVNEVVAEEVLTTYRGTTYYWVELSFDDETITATRGHLFWAESEKEWIPAIDLGVGTEVRCKSGEIKQILRRRIRSLETVEDTFNLEVRSVHCYFVGRSSILVHNGKEDSKDWEPKEGKDTGPDQSRRAAMREAKRASNIPTSQSHSSHDRHVRDRTNPGKTVTEYNFKNVDGEEVMIPDHRNGHAAGNVPPHFNDTSGGHHAYRGKGGC